MISIKDYANEQKVSYEAVRQQLHRYEDELSSHIVKEGRIQYLDDFAVEFLNQKRGKQIITVYKEQDNLEKELEEEKRENKNLLIKLNESQAKVTELQSNIIAMQQERLAIGSPEVLKIELEAKKEQMDDLKRQLEEERQRRLEAEKEASSYTKTIFGFFKKTK